MFCSVQQLQQVGDEGRAASVDLWILQLCERGDAWRRRDPQRQLNDLHVASGSLGWGWKVGRKGHHPRHLSCLLPRHFGLNVRDPGHWGQTQFEGRPLGWTSKANALVWRRVWPVHEPGGHGQNVGVSHSVRQISDWLSVDRHGEWGKPTQSGHCHV